MPRLDFSFNPPFCNDIFMASGSGLGLAIAKQLVALHGGRFWAESQPNQGITFDLILPTPHQKEMSQPLVRPTSFLF
ncbi:MAG TPA: ATP-binding protein [Anaerolineae bacterium]|nr:ATP-binding protein [Anaerolineae bacterium]